MTEAEWLACNSPMPMLVFLRGDGDGSDVNRRIHDARLRGEATVITHLASLWTDDPIGAATLAIDVAVAVAWHEGGQSVANTCAGASEADWFEWSFTGPPDSRWQEARSAEERS